MTEGTFVWTSGEPWIYSHWATGEPNNGAGAGENCALQTIATGLWGDCNCAGCFVMPGVCETELWPW
jgi:pulmonary surfactant-associated protein D